MLKSMRNMPVTIRLKLAVAQYRQQLCVSSNKHFNFKW